MNCITIVGYCAAGRRASLSVYGWPVALAPLHTSSTPRVSFHETNLQNTTQGHQCLSRQTGGNPSVNISQNEEEITRDSVEVQVSMLSKFRLSRSLQL